MRTVNTETLVLVEDNLDAHKLIVTWAQVGEQYQNAKSDGEKEEAREKWSRISGVDPEDIERLEPVLFENGIIAEGGLVDPTVLGFIRKKVIDSLGRGTSKKREGS